MYDTKFYGKYSLRIVWWEFWMDLGPGKMDLCKGNTPHIGNPYKNLSFTLKNQPPLMILDPPEQAAERWFSNRNSDCLIEHALSPRRCLALPFCALLRAFVDSHLHSFAGISGVVPANQTKERAKTTKSS